MSNKLTINHGPIDADEKDFFNRKSLADILYKYVRELSDSGGIIGLLGSWGSGKTSISPILLKICAERQTERQYINININAWNLHDTFILEHIALELADKLSHKYNVTNDKKKKNGIPIDLSPEYFRSILFDQLVYDCNGVKDIAANRKMVLNIINNKYPILISIIVFIVWAIVITGFLTITAYTKSIHVHNHLLPILAIAALCSILMGIGSITSNVMASIFTKHYLSNIGITSPPGRDRISNLAIDMIIRLCTYVKNTKNTTIILWVEDIDRCDSNNSLNILWSLKNLSNVPFLVTIIECDENTLMSSWEKNSILFPASSVSMFQKLFDHTVSIPPITLAQRRDLIYNVGNQELGIDNEALDIILFACESSPRKIKHVLERTAQLSFLIERAKDEFKIIGINTDNKRPIAYLESLREEWPDLWNLIKADTYLLDQLFLEFEGDINNTNNPIKRIAGKIGVIDGDMDNFIDFLSLGRMLSTYSWQPYLTFLSNVNNEDENNINYNLILSA